LDYFLLNKDAILYFINEDKSAKIYTLIVFVCRN